MGLFKLVRNLLLLVIPILLLWGCNGGQVRASDKDLETKVLDIIRKNPLVILESVQKYQQDQANTQRQSVYKNVIGKPQDIIRQSPVTGATDRKIILAEFSDFQCPFCRQSQAAVKEFMEKHKQSVTLTYKHFPLQQIHAEALPAARASWAANQQQKFWPYHDQLFEQQDKLGNELYIQIAQKLGLDLDRFNRDRNSEESEKGVLADFQLGRELGIEGTPAFYMNDRFLSGAVSVADFEAALKNFTKP